MEVSKRMERMNRDQLLVLAGWVVDDVVESSYIAEWM